MKVKKDWLEGKLILLKFLFEFYQISNVSFLNFSFLEFFGKKLSYLSIY